MSTLRTMADRRANVLEALGRQNDMWLATSDRSGRPHLIAVSGWWDGSRLTVATTGTSRTARNLTDNPTARVALGTPDDVVVIDVVADAPAAAEDSTSLATGFAEAVGWDPREVGTGWVFFRLSLRRIQAYRGYDELQGRDVMRNGTWLE